MADLSKYSTEELQKLAGVVPTTPASSYDTESLQKLASMYTPPNTTSTNIDSTPKGDILDYPIAMGAGIKKGLTNVAGLMGEFVTDLATKTGAISPQTAKTLKQKGSEVMSALGDPTAIDQQAKDIHPYIYKGGEITGEIAALGGSAGALTKALGGSIVADIGANAVLGAAVSPENRTMGAALGGAGASLAGIIGAGTNKLVNAGTARTQVTQFVDKLNKGLPDNLSPNQVVGISMANKWNATQEASDELFKQFRNAVGDVVPEAAIIKNTSESVLKNYDNLLTASQKSVLKDTAAMSASAKSLADLHDIRKYLNANYKNFQSEAKNSNLWKEFQNVINTTNNSMAKTANVLNVGPQYRQANSFYQQELKPLENAGFRDLVTTINDPTRRVEAASMIDKLISSNIKASNPTATKEFVKLLPPKAKQAVETQIINNALDSTLSNGQVKNLQQFNQFLGKWSKSSNTIFSPETKQALKGLQKVIDENVALQQYKPNKFVGGFILGSAIYKAADVMGIPMTLGIAGVAALGKYLLSTPHGQQLLIKASKPGGRAIAKQLLEGSILKGITTMNDFTTPSKPDNTMPDGPAYVTGVRN